MYVRSVKGPVELVQQLGIAPTKVAQNCKSHTLCTLFASRTFYTQTTCSTVPSPSSVGQLASALAAGFSSDTPRAHLPVLGIRRSTCEFASGGSKRDVYST